MDSIAATDSGVEGQESQLADVTRLRLPDLLDSDDSVLANSLRRLVAEIDRPHEVIAAFTAYAR